MKKYALIFSLAYIVTAVLVEIVAELFKLGSSGVIGMAAILGASMYAAMQFTKDHQREPTLAERKTFAWQALLGLWGVTITVFAVVFAVFGDAGGRKLMSELLATSWILMAMIFGVLLLSFICYIAIRWSFGWYAKNTLGAMGKS